MTEKDWEKLLRIKTTGRDDSRSNTYRYPIISKILYNILYNILTLIKITTNIF